MIKAKKYDWKDSNLAMFGSDTEKQVKKESAESEPAWEGAGEKVGMQIWRINKFKVEHWPKEEYGNFFNGDSYILLNTYVSLCLKHFSPKQCRVRNKSKIIMGSFQKLMPSST